MADTIDQYADGDRLMVVARVVKRKKGTFKDYFADLLKDGYLRVVVDGQNYMLDEEIELDKNKKQILKLLGKHARELRGERSQFILASENDISVSIISTIERAMKDPQLTTVFKLAEALNIKPSEFIKLIENDLPKNFSMIDK